MADVERSLQHRSWVHRRRPKYGLSVFDLGHGGPEVARDTAKDYAPPEEHAPQGRRGA